MTRKLTGCNKKFQCIWYFNNKIFKIMEGVSLKEEEIKSEEATEKETAIADQRKKWAQGKRKLRSRR